jgi:serine/threonine protein kinase
MVDRPSRRQRDGWSIASSEEESRSYLQERLERLSQVLFFCFTAFLVFMWLMYRIEPDLTPAYSDVTFATNALGVAVIALVWRMLRRGTQVSMRWLAIIYAGGVGVFLAFNGVFGTDLLFAPFTCLLFACLVVLTRAIIVPSDGRWTALLSSLTLGPMVIAAVAIAIDGWPHAPPVALVGTVLSICVLVVLLAAVGSKTSYGLRQKVRAAMQLGPYTLDTEIAIGGMGAVYRAHHRLLRRPTAVKIVQPDKVGADTLDRFEKEVQATSQLTHPNTVAVFDYGRSPQGVFYYAMEYLDGIDLERLVQRYGPQPQGRVVAILSQVASALHEAHGKKLVHRDVKPANIMLCERGALPDIAKVLDFGLVKEIAQDTNETRQILVGTPGYIAPENVTDPSLVSAAADIYSLGAVAYFLLVGRRVFEGKSPLDICVKHVTEPAPPLENISAPLAVLVERCLSKSPESRPTALDLVHQLRRVEAADWTESQALAWWSEFRAKRASVPVDLPTQTITVDVDHRAATLLATKCPRCSAPSELGRLCLACSAS